MNYCSLCNQYYNIGVSHSCYSSISTSNGNLTLCNYCSGFYLTGTTHYCTSSSLPYFPSDPLSTLNSLLNIRRCINEKGRCSKCKQDKELIVAYKVIKIERKLCEDCLLIAADKLFGIEHLKLEESLYGK